MGFLTGVLKAVTLGAVDLDAGKKGGGAQQPPQRPDTAFGPSTGDPTTDMILNQVGQNNNKMNGNAGSSSV